MGLVERKRYGRTRRGVIWARAAAPAGLMVLVAACSSPGSTSAAGSTPSAAPTVTVSSAPASATSSTTFINIVEPFDPGHAARSRSGPSSCGAQSSTVAIEQCYEIQTENTDVGIDAAQATKFVSATPAQRTAIQADDRAWLAARQPVCASAFHSGGTIDGVNTATCLLAESNARYETVHDIAVPEIKLKASDSPNLGDLSWYTTPEGSRIAEIDTQGDQTGGAIVAWVIIGGADGFVVNPKQFYYLDSPFTDPGIVQGTSPAGHKVATGQQYQFSIDYSTLSKDPNSSKNLGGYVYAPGSPVAEWGA